MLHSVKQAIFQMVWMGGVMVNTGQGSLIRKDEVFERF